MQNIIADLRHKMSLISNNSNNTNKLDKKVMESELEGLRQIERTDTTITTTIIPSDTKLHSIMHIH